MTVTAVRIFVEQLRVIERLRISFDYLGKAVRLTYYRLYPYLQNPMLPGVIRDVHSFGLPVTTPLLLSAAAMRHFKSDTHRGEGGLLGLATTDNPYTTCGQDHCVFTIANAAFLLITTHDRSPFVIPYDVRTRFARRLRGMSAPGGWYDALFSHLFWHVLDRRVALIFWLFIIIFSSYITAGCIPIRSIRISFYGLFQAQSQQWTSQHNATTAGLLIDVSVAGIIGSVLFTTTRTFIFLHKMACLRCRAVLPH